MIIGVPKEIKVQEYRVGLTPAGAAMLTADGHEIVVQASAGEGAGYSDEEYLDAGVRILPAAADVYGNAELICKVKEPLLEEVPLLQKGQILFCYLHLAPLPELTGKLLAAGLNAVALETIQTPDGQLPCLLPMSEIAGRMAVQIAAHCLERKNGGRGVLLSGASGVAPAKVSVLGGGCAGMNAARVAHGMGAQVTVLDVDLKKLAHLDALYGGRIHTVCSNAHNIARFVAEADVVIGAVLIPGAQAPKLVTEAMVATMKKGTVVIDISVDQGGCVETCRSTTHDQPTYRLHEVIHYCVPNMPGAVPRTSTEALTNATLPWLRQIANRGLVPAAQHSEAIRLGINLFLAPGHDASMLTCKPVAEAQGRDYQPLVL